MTAALVITAIGNISKLHLLWFVPIFHLFGTQWLVRLSRYFKKHGMNIGKAEQQLGVDEMWKNFFELQNTSIKPKRYPKAEDNFRQLSHAMTNLEKSVLSSEEQEELWLKTKKNLFEDLDIPLSFHFNWMNDQLEVFDYISSTIDKVTTIGEVKHILACLNNCRRAINHVSLFYLGFRNYSTMRTGFRNSCGLRKMLKFLAKEAKTKMKILKNK